jgi:transposase
MNTRQVHADDAPILVWEELDKLHAELGDLHARILGYDQRIEVDVRTDVRARRLAAIHGVGAITASAVVATVGNGRDFKNGRRATRR